MTPKMRWVAPPNWPTMPAGFEPPEGWQPDPSWPPPPEGWQFWQSTGIDVNSGLPWYRRISNKQWGLGIAAVIIIAVVVSAIATSGHTHRKIDTQRLDRDVEHWMTTHIGSTSPMVKCPSGEAATEGNEFICDATDQTGKAHIDVTVINSNGDVKWQVIG